MANKPPGKKSEALEIRVSHEEKQAFMAAVKQRRKSASSVIREAMAHFAQPRLNWKERMMNRIIVAGIVLAISAVSIAGWEVMRRGQFGTAYAEGVTSNFQMRIGLDDAGVQRVFRTNTQIVVMPGETGVLEFDFRSPRLLAALLPEEAPITRGVLSVEVSVNEMPDSDLYIYSLNVSVIDRDGVAHPTSINPRIAIQMDSAASIDSRFGTEAEIFINLIPLTVER
jgi:hypothetical protein